MSAFPPRVYYEEPHVCIGRQCSSVEMFPQVPLGSHMLKTHGGTSVTLIWTECQTLIPQPFTLAQLDGPNVRTGLYTSKSHCQV